VFRTGEMLSFDEFRATANRERNKENVKEQDAPKKSRKKSAILEDDLNNNRDGNIAEKTQGKSIPESIGEFLELHSMQVFYIVLLILDTFGAFLELYLMQLSSKNSSFHIYVKALKSFSKFTSMVFSFEIFLVYIAFGLPSLFHLGYLTDLIVLFFQLYLDYRGYGCEIRMLNIFRLWRPMRLLNAVVAYEKEQQNRLKNQVENMDEEIKKKQFDIDNVKLELTKEKEAKLAVENMLVNYKEEVDTLNEALKIAAFDIAEVGQNEEELFTSEDEENEEGTVGSRSKNDSLSTADRSKRSAKLEILRTALEGNPIVGVNESKSTFVVHEDGRFEKK
jgi:hypothetical protein